MGWAADDIDPSDHLRDGMLDLQPGVHFHERERAVLPPEHLYGTSPYVPRCERCSDRKLPYSLPGVLADNRRGRLLDELLVASLDRALSLSKVDRASSGIRQHLDLDVACPLGISLDIDGGVAERTAGL